MTDVLPPQPTCANCSNPVPPGFTTCSEACTTEWRSRGRFGYDAPSSPEGTVTTRDLAHALHINPGTLMTWMYQGKIPVERVGSKLCWRIEEVRKAIEAGGLRTRRSWGLETEKIESGPVEIVIRSDMPLLTEESTPLRDRMLRAAKEAARDVCLLAADEFKRIGKHEDRANCLDDFIRLEEGLKMVFHG